ALMTFQAEREPGQRYGIRQDRCVYHAGGFADFAADPQRVEPANPHVAQGSKVTATTIVTFAGHGTQRLSRDWRIVADGHGRLASASVEPGRDLRTSRQGRTP